MLTSTRAQLDQARANLWRDQTDHDRMQKLFDSGVESAQDRDHAEATLQCFAGQREIARGFREGAGSGAGRGAGEPQASGRARKRDSPRPSRNWSRRAPPQRKPRRNSGYTKIYAPIDGIVSVRVAKQGEVVAQGSPIVVIVDVDHLWVRADVEESYIDSVRFGQTMRVRLPSGDILQGQVFFKGVENDFATQRDVSRTKRDIKTFAIKVSLPNQGRRLFTGMTATVLLPPPEKKSWFARL